MKIYVVSYIDKFGAKATCLRKHRFDSFDAANNYVEWVLKTKNIMAKITDVDNNPIQGRKTNV